MAHPGPCLTLYRATWRPCICERAALPIRAVHGFESASAGDSRGVTVAPTSDRVLSVPNNGQAELAAPKGTLFLLIRAQRSTGSVDQPGSASAGRASSKPAYDSGRTRDDSTLYNLSNLAKKHQRELVVLSQQSQRLTALLVTEQAQFGLAHTGFKSSGVCAMCRSGRLFVGLSNRGAQRLLVAKCA